MVIVRIFFPFSLPLSLSFSFFLLLFQQKKENVFNSIELKRGQLSDPVKFAACSEFFLFWFINCFVAKEKKRNTHTFFFMRPKNYHYHWRNLKWNEMKWYEIKNHPGNDWRQKVVKKNFIKNKRHEFCFSSFIRSLSCLFLNKCMCDMGQGLNWDKWQYLPTSPSERLAMKEKWCRFLWSVQWKTQSLTANHINHIELE